jgi:hypothetical protein
MRDRDPLEDWWFRTGLEVSASRASEFRTQLQETLDELEAYLAHPPEKINYGASILLPCAGRHPLFCPPG